VKRLILALKFVFFTEAVQNVGFSWNNFVITYDVKMYMQHFLLYFFDILKYVQNVFEIKGAFAPEPKRLVRIFIHILYEIKLISLHSYICTYFVSMRFMSM
jgi:hypothetical protein